MRFDGLLVAMCAGAVGIALWRGGRYLADGGGRRRIRARARVVRVWDPPKEGARRSSGIPAEITFVAPDSGREMVLSAEDRGLDAAWPGRAIEVRYPAGRPERFRVTSGPRRLDRDLGASATATSLLLLVLVGHFTDNDGFHKELIGFGVLWMAVSAVILAFRLAEIVRRRVLLASRAPATGRIVAVLTSRYGPEESPKSAVLFTPVVTFTTHEGHQVTAVCPVGSSSRYYWAGREVSLHYARTDHSVFALDLLGDRLLVAGGLLLLVFFFTFGAALTVAGLLLTGGA
jgi:hypothetical protein